MITKHILMLSGAVALAAMAAGTASSQTSQGSFEAGTIKTRFLTPLPARFVMPPPDSTFCRELRGSRCPPVLVYGGAAGNHLPTIEPVLKADLPNVRVSFVLQEIANKPVANGGVNDPHTFVEWTTTGPAAWEENGGPYAHPLPPPNGIWDEDDLLYSIIYDALVFNACESFPVFPVVHDVSIELEGSEIGAFNGVDNTTLDHTGFYNFSYTVRATGMNGRVSDFRFSGKVNVTCSGLNALPLP
jgi:hypothetical protein